MFVSFGFGFSVTETPEGWASQSGGTKGGTGGPEVTVSTMSQLSSEAKSSGKKIIIARKGTYTGNLTVSSDKTIVGEEPGVLIKGSVRLSNVNNVILRNFAVQGDRCDSYDACKSGRDAVGITSGAHHIWLDHLDVCDGQDGNCDLNNGADFVTITWCKFWYSYAKEHRYSNLISGGDNIPGDKGKLNTTYAYCWWAERVDQRMPRGRSGKVHVVNNLYTCGDASYACGPGVDMQMLIENNVFNNGGSAIKPFDGSPAPAFKSVGNIGTARDIDRNQGTVFTPPYELSLKMEASEVKAAVEPAAGNTMTLGEVTVRNVRGRANAVKTHFVSYRTGSFLRNTTSAAVTFTVFNAGGKTLLRDTRLEKGGSYQLPSGKSVLFVRCNGVSGTSVEPYVPVVK